MKATQVLHDLGQSLSLDSVSRQLLINGEFKRYIEDVEITGPTSNPTIFDHAIRNSADYDVPIRQQVGRGATNRELVRRSITNKR